MTRKLLLGVCMAAAAVFSAISPGCLERRDDDSTPNVNECSACHGDDKRRGTALQRSAPPIDLLGNTDVAYPGVGAHDRHTYATSRHGAVRCSECHEVPDHVGDRGHADTAAPAEIEFGELALQQGGAAEYDRGTRRCANTYCHGNGEPVWTRPQPSADTCGTCHGLPPPAPHPQSTACNACHADVIGADGVFVAAQKHVNGVVDVDAPSCTNCHGGDGNPAPPVDVAGNSDTSFVGVGAHRAHLAGGMSSRAVACDECHRVPQAVADEGHLDEAPAEVVLTGVATRTGRDPRWNRETLQCANGWCHSPSSGTTESPRWTDAAPLTCTTCHGAPPAAPHPQMSDCSLCHGSVIAEDDITMLDRARHVDGVIDAVTPNGCSSCHGSALSAAPPADVLGNIETSAPGVGAHQIHLMGTANARAVPCDECHTVPQSTLSTGHVDTPIPAELVFSGAAVAFGAAPSYDGTTCKNTFCHGASFVGNHASGGSLTEPSWTRVDGTQTMCGSCHALPPPAPHPANADDCSACHHDIDANRTFVRPDLHVDGDVTFDVQ